MSFTLGRRRMQTGRPNSGPKWIYSGEGGPLRSTRPTMGPWPFRSVVRGRSETQGAVFTFSAPPARSERVVDTRNGRRLAPPRPPAQKRGRRGGGRHGVDLHRSASGDGPSFMRCRRQGTVRRCSSPRTQEKSSPLPCSWGIDPVVAQPGTTIRDQFVSKRNTLRRREIFVLEHHVPFFTIAVPQRPVFTSDHESRETFGFHLEGLASFSLVMWARSERFLLRLASLI